MKFFPTLPILLMVFFGACRPDGPSDEAAVVPPPPPVVERDSNYYMELNRPGFHFSPPSGFMREPNGMVYHNGEYHLFYQYNPNGNADGAWNWGHAVTKNLSNWEHLPVALQPDGLGKIGGGSVVMDYLNSSGFGKKKQAAMVAAFTHHDTQSQGIAYSLDDGRTWTKYAKNPVIPNPGLEHFRDPKLLWYGPTKQWIMVVSAGNRVQIYQSGDLKEWTLASEFGADHGSHEGLGLWKKPDLFYLPYKGAEEGGKWLLVVSIDKGREKGGTGVQYFIGDFDGTTFTNSNPKETVLWMDYGLDHTGLLSCSGTAPGDLRKIVIGWLSNDLYAAQLPTDAWRNTLTMPRSLVLKKHAAGLTLDIQPLKEVKKVRVKTDNFRSLLVEGRKDMTSETDIEPHTSVILLDIMDKDNKKPDVGLELSNSKGEKLRIGYDFKTSTYYIDRRASGQVDFSDIFSGVNSFRTGLDKNRINIFAFADGCAIEVFVESSTCPISNLVFPTEPYDQLVLYSEGGEVEMKSRMMKMGRSW